MRPPFFNTEVALERPARHVSVAESGAANMGNSAEFGGLLFVCVGFCGYPSNLTQPPRSIELDYQGKATFPPPPSPPPCVGKGLRGNIWRPSSLSRDCSLLALSSNYRVTHLLVDLGCWVDLDLGCSTILSGQ